MLNPRKHINCFLDGKINMEKVNLLTQMQLLEGILDGGQFGVSLVSVRTCFLHQFNEFLRSDRKSHTMSCRSKNVCLIPSCNVNPCITGVL